MIMLNPRHPISHIRQNVAETRTGAPDYGDQRIQPPSAPGPVGRSEWVAVASDVLARQRSAPSSVACASSCRGIRHYIATFKMLHQYGPALTAEDCAATPGQARVPEQWPRPRQSRSCPLR